MVECDGTLKNEDYVVKTNRFLLFALLANSISAYFVRPENFRYSLLYLILIILPYEIFGRYNVGVGNLVMGYCLGGMIGFTFPRTLRGCIILTLSLGFFFSLTILGIKNEMETRSQQSGS